MLRLLIRVPGSVAIKATEQGTRLGVRGGYAVRNAEALRGPEAGRVALPGSFLFFSIKWRARRSFSQLGHIRQRPVLEYIQIGSTIQYRFGGHGVTRVHRLVGADP